MKLNRPLLAWGTASCAVALFLVSCGFSLAVGSRDMPLGDALSRIPAALRYASDSGAAGGDEFTVIIATLRVPRTLLALLAGTALGIAGTLIQGHTRNALADPGLLGINAGAAVAVVAGVYCGIPDPVFLATAGAGIATMAVFALSSTGPTAANPLTLILAGSAITSLLMAIVNGVVISDTNALDTLRTWATGSVAGRSIGEFYAALPFFVAGLVLAAFQPRPLNLLSMGEDAARALGLNVTTHRILGFAAIALLGGAAVSAAGPVAFIGLAGPHAARAVLGPDYRLVLPSAGLAGGALALWADIIGRLVVASELPMGIVLGLVGAPVFIVLVKRGRVVAP